LKKVLIVEDQENTLEWLRNIVVTCGDLEVLAVTNVGAAYKHTLEKTIDLFLVDIILEPAVKGDSSGLRFVDNIRNMKKYAFTPVIFLSSLEDSKLYTYEELHCYGFIEKPFDEGRIRKLVLESLEFPGGERDRRMLYFRRDGIIFAAEREAIVYIEMIKQRLYLHTAEERILYVPYMTLKQMTDLIDNPDMVQCRRNLVVNTRYISNVDIPNRIIQLKNGFGRIEIGLSYKKSMKEYFKSYN
jgi:DNA-binding LytR/AlgR family response regulator